VGKRGEKGGRVEWRSGSKRGRSRSGGKRCTFEFLIKAIFVILVFTLVTIALSFTKHTLEY
jgi:hypothetical protein